MEIKVNSIIAVESNLKNTDTNNIKAIIVSSYNHDIETLPKESKLILNFDDITTNKSNSFNKTMAKQIHNFIDSIDFNNQKLYVCCDSGESRSSAIAACILRKNKENENIIWKNHTYHPNIFVYDTLCKEFGLRNTNLRLKYKKYINEKAFKSKIKKSKKVS